MELFRSHDSMFLCFYVVNYPNKSNFKFEGGTAGRVMKKIHSYMDIVFGMPCERRSKWRRAILPR